MKNIEKIIAPKQGDTVENVLLEISPFVQMVRPDKVYDKEKGFILYNGSNKYRQTIIIFLVMSNGQIFENKTWVELPEEDIDSFMQSGFFKQENNKWVVIPNKDFYNLLNK